MDAWRDLADLFGEADARGVTIAADGAGGLRVLGTLTPELRAALKARKADVLDALARGYDAAAAAAWRGARVRDREAATCGCCPWREPHGRACYCDVCLDLDPAWRAARVAMMGDPMAV